MIRLLSILVFPLLFTFSSFHKGSVREKGAGKETEEGSIYIKLVGNPDFEGKERFWSKGLGLLNYLTIRDDVNEDAILLDEIKTKRELLFTTKAQDVILRRYIGFYEFQDFVVHKGDSVLLDFDYRKPINVTSSINRTVSLDYEVEIQIRKRVPTFLLTLGQAEKISPFAYAKLLDSPKELEIHKTRTMLDKRKYIELSVGKQSKEVYNTFLPPYRAAVSVLDSMLTNKQISENVHQIYAEKYENTLLLLEINGGIIDSVSAANKLNALYEKNNSVGQQNCLEAYGSTYFDCQSNWVQVENFHIRDFRNSFLQARSSQVISQEVKERILVMYLRYIEVNFPNDLGKFVKLFDEEAKNEELRTFVDNSFKRVQVKSVVASDLHLMRSDKSQTNIEDVLKKYKGKVVYLDFWASWCQPCIAEMKYSHALKEKYKGKDFEIVYISMDDSFLKWEKSAERLKINEVDKSFQVLDAPNSALIRNFKIKSIPRYMLVNKEGKIVEQSASKPSSSTAIEASINKYL